MTAAISSILQAAYGPGEGRCTWFVGDTIATSQKGRISQAAPTNVTHWISNRTDVTNLAGYGKPTNPEIVNLKAAGKAIHVINWLADGTWNGMPLSEYVFEQAWLDDLAEIHRCIRPDVWTLMHEHETWRKTNSRYTTAAAYRAAIVQRYCDAATWIRQLNPDAKVGITLGGYQWRANPTTDLTPYLPAFAASDFIAVQSQCGAGDFAASGVHMTWQQIRRAAVQIGSQIHLPTFLSAVEIYPPSPSKFPGQTAEYIRQARIDALTRAYRSLLDNMLDPATFAELVTYGLLGVCWKPTAGTRPDYPELEWIPDTIAAWINGHNLPGGAW